MIMRMLRWASCGVLMGLLASPSLAAETTGNAFQAALAHDASVATVKFVLRIKMSAGGSGSEREIEGEIDCPVVGDDGLVLCSNTELGGYVGLLGRMMGGGRDLKISGAPTDIKVLIGNDTEGIEAKLVTRDTERDLAWVQVAEVPETGMGRVLSLEATGDLDVGGDFYAVRRMDKFFGRAPAVVEGVIGAITKQPRRLLIPSRVLDIGFGQLVFDQQGTLVGMTVAQMPDLDEAQDLFRNPLPFLSAAAKVGDMVGGAILPASELRKATALARELIVADAAEMVGE